MCRNFAEPGDSGGFEGDVWVEAAGDGAVDDGLFLFVQQGDHFPLGANGAIQSPVRPVQETGNCGLIVGRRYGNGHSLKVRKIEALTKPRPISVDGLAAIPCV